MLALHFKYFTHQCITKEELIMDWTNLICAGCGLLGTIIGSYSGIRLTSYRVEQLEKRLSQQDTLTARLPVLEEQIKALSQRVEQADVRRHS